MKKILIPVIAVFFYSCSSNSSSSDNSGIDTSKAVVGKTDSVKKVDTAKTSDSSTKQWTYSNEVDKMTSKTNYYATVDANDLLDFPSPYEGGSTATLNIRNTDGKNEALLTISKGQFLSHIDGGTIKIRFDNDQPVTFETNNPSDGSSTVIFIENAAKLIKKLKSSEKIIVASEFYESGEKTMGFNVKNFKWDH